MSKIYVSKKLSKENWGPQTVPFNDAAESVSCDVGLMVTVTDCGDRWDTFKWWWGRFSTNIVTIEFKF